MDILTLPTVIELMNSPAFWDRRTEEQVAYIEAYSKATHTRPDYLDVLNSAHEIQDRCELTYFKIRRENNPF